MPITGVGASATSQENTPAADVEPTRYVRPVTGTPWDIPLIGGASGVGKSRVAAQLADESKDYASRKPGSGVHRHRAQVAPGGC